MTNPNRNETIQRLRDIQRAGQPIGPELVRTMWRRRRFRRAAWATAGAMAVAGTGVGLGLGLQGATQGQGQGGPLIANDGRTTVEGVLPTQGLLVGLSVEERRAKIRELSSDHTQPENEIRPTFVAALDDPDPSVRRLAIAGMAMRNMNPPVEALLSFIDNSFENLEVASAGGDMAAMARELDAWRSQSLRAVSTALMFHAMRGRAIENPARLERLLDSSEPEIRERTLDTLNYIKGYVLPLDRYTQLKNDPNMLVREAAATWAQAHGD